MGRDEAPRFALIGAAGFVAPRHLEAIKSVGGKLVAALDPHDAVGILDRFDRETEFFTEPERFERHLEMLRRAGNPIDWLSVCSPNYLHDAHIRMGLRAGAKVICEKPLVIEPKNLDALKDVESEYATDGQRRIFTVLQLRHMKVLKRLKQSVDARWSGKQEQVRLQYSTPRGHWYQRSWKGDEEKSGGLVMNIGVHMLDLLTWIWGPSTRGGGVLERSPTHVYGDLVLDRAYVQFKLTVDDAVAGRALFVNDLPIDFTTGFEGLHSTVYAETLAGRGHGIEDARPALELAHQLRQH